MPNTVASTRIGDGAASAVEQRVLGWCRSHEGASVAEKREAAKLIMEGFGQAYDDKAAEFASQWYDYRAEQGGARLGQAVTMTVYEPESVDDVARYQAKKLAKEGDAAFARACGEFARNDAFRSLNETIIANVGRDRDKGAMFARVPTGFEPRAVYHTRKTAGEFKHFHRNCDCKVVPSFEGDPEAELVQGVKPRELRERYKRFKEIDETEGLSSAEKDARKRAALDGSVPEAPGWSTSVFERLGAVEAEIDAPLPTGTTSTSSVAGRFKAYALPSGRRFFFKADMDQSRQDMTPERLLSIYEKVPERLNISKTVCKRKSTLSITLTRKTNTGKCDTAISPGRMRRAVSK